MTWTLPDPMLTTPVSSPDLPPGAAAEPKWGGYRAQLAALTGGRVLLRSRQGISMSASSPEIQDAPSPSCQPAPAPAPNELMGCVHQATIGRSSELGICFRPAAMA
ncbi:hypothetical protein GCM10023323_21930 [Streptomyces thinghirensis]|uniref:ATP-dependent DNA ligase family profile domain-containing protein n=1 Tax=Streptomyces thinghirensis TaxID=551547 RepID=A0ABP9SZZ2_9ACTN